MEKNKKDKTQFVLKISLGFTLLLIVLLLFPQYFNKSFATDKEVNEEFCYLSDISYVKEQSSVGWGSITLDQNLDTKYNQGLITLIVDGKQKKFLKGVAAHATSTLVYDVSELDYDYFSTYYGVDSSRGATGNGVKFSIYTSVDGENWDLHTLVSPPVKKGNSEAEFITVDIKDKKYIKLYAHNNGNADGDHSVYANAKLYKEGYVEDNSPVDFIKTVEEYDEILKNKSLEQQLNEYELTLLQRTFVKNVGYDMLQAFAKCKNENKDTISWLMNNLENLHLYILGGTPDGGSYYNSLTQLVRLYSKYKDDFTIQELTNNKWYPEMTKGYVYKKMAISLSLTHSTAVGYWAQINHPTNRSDALNRYEIYKYLYDNGKFVVSERQDHTPWFEALKVEEMRYVMNNILDDEELIWLNEYTQKRIDEHPNKEETYLQPHTYIAYVWPNFANPIYHDPDNYEYWDTLFEGIFSKYGVTYSTETDKVYKAWMSMRNKYGTGAVCGGISKLGTHIRAAHGTPASVIGQPGHAAIIYYRKDANGYGYWSMDNDVSGWAQSGKAERLGIRMPLGWGNDSYVSGWAATYILLSQEALNDFENYQKAEEIMMTVDLYEDNVQKQEEIYRKALEAQPINIDAWHGLIKLYKSDEYKSYLDTINKNKEEALFNLATEICENLKCFPLPVYNLLNLIKPELTSIEYSFRFTLLQTNTLTEGSKLEPAEVYQPGKAGSVFQPSIARTVANYLLGQIDKTLATFSFDGEDKGKIVLSSRFDNTGIRWDYSIDGKQNWVEVSFNADEEHKLQLTPEQVNSITAENDIYVHIVGTGYEESNLYKIDITEQALPNILYANDLENRVVGVNLGTEWRYTEGDEWTSYSVNSPDLIGNKTVQVRQGATGTKLTSEASPIYTFTEDNQPDTRKYIPVSHLSINSVSTQAVNNSGAATNAIDANYNTRWHSAWNGSDSQRFITVKLDKSVSLSAVEFVPAGGGNGKIIDGTIYGSMDGENWEELVNMKNLTYTNQANTNEDAIANTKNFEIEEPKEVQYVKIVADRATNGNWFAARAFNFYQDLTKNPHPTAGIAYSTTEQTNGNVIARLVNPSTEITITNNDGKDTYLFTENGEFTFEFEDKNGNKGTAVAIVNWIDKDIPSADIKYGLDSDKKLLILLDNISEDVYLLDENDKKINYVEVDNGKVTNISYLDDSGDTYKVLHKDENGDTKKITYKNTTGNVPSVEVYTTTLENGIVTSEEYFDSEGNNVIITDEEKEDLRQLQQTTRSNPLEYALETSGEYKFKLIDKAENILYKSIKVDYINNDNTIIASDITYDITKLTNNDVIATINPYIIDVNGKQVDVEIVNNEKNNKYTFAENGEFTFEYREISDTDSSDIKQHKAKVDWIDKTVPTADVKYNITEATDKAVVATLVNESEAITITNNGTSREYTFTKNGEFVFEFEDKAGNKGTVAAKVDWINTDSEPNPEPDKDKIITSDKYKIGKDTIFITLPTTQKNEGITVNEFKENIFSQQEYVVLDKNGDISEEGIIKTDMKLKVGNDVEYTVVIIGDVDQDGKITINDLAKLKLHYIKYELLTGASLQAADVDEDENLTINDIAKIKLMLIGLM